jgi:serine/threonine protein kinase
MFTNACLDSPFVPPEMIFSKFQDHTSAIDVWAFGMILYCVLFGKNPASYYKVYREWYMRSHGHDVEISNLPFIRPSNKNFIYDPFSIDFDSPFDKFDYEEFIQSQSHESKNLDNVFNFAD